MSTSFSRSFVAATYLSGARGAELAEKVPAELAKIEGPLVRALQSADREVRARFLAAAARDLTAEMQARVLRLER